jgi:hypothetical protein
MIRDHRINLIESIGVVGIIASLIFVGMQVRQDQRIAEAQIYAESATLGIELSRLINDNREVWSKGSKGEEPDGTDRRSSYQSIKLAC